MSRLLHCLILNRRPRRWIAALALANYLTLCCGVSLPAAATAPLDGLAFPCQGHRCGCATAEKCWRDCCCFTMAEKLAWAKSHGVTPPAYVVAEAPPPAKKCCCSTEGSGARGQGPGEEVRVRSSEFRVQRLEVCGRQDGTPYPVPSTHSEAPLSAVGSPLSVTRNPELRTPNSTSEVCGISPGTQYPVPRTQSEAPLSAVRSPLSVTPNSEPRTHNSSISFLDALRCRGQSSNWLNLPWSVTPDSPLDLIGLELVASPLGDVRLPSLPTLSFRPSVPPPRAA